VLLEELGFGSSDGRGEVVGDEIAGDRFDE
jgi:hypothetical protein